MTTTTVPSVDAKYVADRIRSRATYRNSEGKLDPVVSSLTLTEWADLLDPQPKTKKVVRVVLEVAAEGPSSYALNVKAIPAGDAVITGGYVAKRPGTVVSAEVIEVPA